MQWWHIPVGLLAFTLALASDWAETRYVRAVRAWENGEDAARYRAANYSCAMLLVGCIGLYSVIVVGWWTIVPEILGLRAGTLLALRR